MKNQRFQQTLKTNIIYVLLLLGMNCNSEKQIDIQGHRGCRGLFPENSLPAFEKAIDLGVTTLELDIVVSKDKKIVVSHEPVVNPKICYNPKGQSIPLSQVTAFNLYLMNYEEIKKYDCGSKYYEEYPNQEKLKTYKPLLSEVFDLVKTKKSDVRFNIEIKTVPQLYGIYSPLPRSYVKLVLNEIKRYDMFSRVTLQSFDIKILEEIKKQDPTIQVALLIDEYETIASKLKQLSYKPEIISPYFKLLNGASVKQYQQKGFQIIPWTVNEEKDMEKLIEWQVDGIITDYPDVLIALLKT